MSHWSFVALAYGLTTGATGALLLWSWLSMRKAEAAADAVKRR